MRQAIARAEAAFAAGEHEQAADKFGEALRGAESLLGQDESVTVESLARMQGSHAFFLLFASRFADAEQAARRGLSLDSSQVWIQSNLAHALMFQGRREEALALYAKFAGEVVIEDRRWEDVIREDFELLRHAGLSRDLMNEVLESFTPP